MEEKFLKLNKGLTLTFKGFVYAALLVFLIVGIWGYIFSYNDMTKFLSQNENKIPSLINSIIVINIIFILFDGAFVFGVCGKKFNFKNVIKLILMVPMFLFVLAGYLMSSESFTTAYDISNYLLFILFIISVFLGGMKLILLLIREYRLVKKEPMEAENFNNKKVD